MENSKRFLTEEEIKNITDVLKPNKYIPKDVSSVLLANIKNNIVSQLRKISIFPSAIPLLKDQIIKSYDNSLIQPGEMVGTIAASSIGESVTQQSLNSFHSVIGDSKVVIYKEENGKWKCVEDEIGHIIDTMLENNNYKKMNYEGTNEVNESEPYAEVHELTDNWKIGSVDENGKTSYQKVTHLVRHPLYTKLLEVKTKSGRSIKATSGWSFLTNKNGKLEKTLGSSLKIGDRLPLPWKFEDEKEMLIDTINLRTWFSPSKYIYGDDLYKAKQIRDNYLEEFKLQDKKGNCPWWKHHNQDFVLPYNRADSAIVAFQGTPSHPLHDEQKMKNGCIYGKVRTGNISHIPESIPLDRLTGFFIGAFLSDGCVNEHHIIITKYDESFRNKIKEFCDRWSLGYHVVLKGYKYKHMNNYERKQGRKLTDEAIKNEDSTDEYEIRIQNTILANWITDICGRRSENKKIPSFCYNSNLDFLKGLFDGLFSGDGTIYENEINYSSCSKKLIDGISLLLTRISVFCKIRKSQLSSNNKNSKSILPSYTLVFSCGNCNRFYNFVEYLTHSEKQNKIILFSNNKTGLLLNQKYWMGRDEDNTCKDFENVYMDEIIEINDVTEEFKTTHKYVYDFSVENTLNFLSNGILLYDSSGAAKVNLTGGLVRQKELLNASKNIKTPSCNIHLDPNAIDIKDLFKVIEFANSNLKYYEFQDLIINYNIYNSGETEFTVEEKNYYNLYSFMNEDINLDSLQNKIRIQFEFDLEKIYKIKKNFETISAIIYSILDPEKTNLQIITYPIYTSKIDIWVNNNIQDVETILNLIEKKKSNITITESVKENVNKIISIENMYYKYVKNIVVPSILKIPISGIFGIEECYYSDDKEKNWFIDTKGSNLKEILCNLSINTKKTKSNNMYDIYETFGIDAANTFLIEEFSKIINVNKRHLYLLINSMTIGGKIKSVSRYGIDRKQVGPLAKACFEQPVDNFLISATKGEKELLKGVSSTICVGKLCKMGTGMIDLLPDTKKLKKIEIVEHIKTDNSGSSLPRGGTPGAIRSDELRFSGPDNQTDDGFY
jgi:intein/homing endonuclease